MRLEHSICQIMPKNDLCGTRAHLSTQSQYFFFLIPWTHAICCLPLQFLIFCLKWTFRVFLDKNYIFFSFVDLVYLAAGIDKHGVKNLFLPVFLPFPLHSEFSLSFLSCLPPSPPFLSLFSARPFFKYTAKILQTLVSDNICHSSEEWPFIFKDYRPIFRYVFSTILNSNFLNIFQCSEDENCS